MNCKNWTEFCEIAIELNLYMYDGFNTLELGEIMQHMQHPLH